MDIFGRNWKTSSSDWFKGVLLDIRARFAREFGNIVVFNGHECLVVSYPRPQGTVMLFDIDSDRIRSIGVLDLIGCEIIRKVRVDDFLFSKIVSSVYWDEAVDIRSNLFDIVKLY